MPKESEALRLAEALSSGDDAGLATLKGEGDGDSGEVSVPGGLDPSEMLEDPEPLAPPTIQSPAMGDIEQTPQQRFSDEADSTVVEVEPEPPTARKPFRRKTAATRQPSSRRKRSLFQNVLPPNERLMVYKRDSKGNLAYVGNYGPGEVSRSGNIETFLNEYVVPSYGYGEYSLIISDAKGDSKPQGSITIQGPINKGDSQVSSLTEVVKLMGSMNEAAEKKTSDQASNMTAMITAMSAMNQNKGNDMMPIMMMMMNQNNQPKQDSSLQMLLPFLMKQMENDSSQMPFPMFPPQLPNSSSSDVNFGDIIKAVGDITKLNQQPQKSFSDELLLSLLTKVTQKDSNSFGVKDIVAILPEIRNLVRPVQEGSSNFKGYMEDLAQLDELLDGRRRGDDGNLWSSIAETVGSVFRDIKMAQHDNLVAQQQGMALAPGQQQAPAQRKSDGPSIPMGFSKFALHMKKAFSSEDESTLMRSFLEALLFLREKDEKWKVYVEKFFTCAHAEDKEKAMKFVEAFLKTFVKKKHITNEIGGAIYETIDTYWEQVMEALGLKIPDEQSSSPFPGEKSKSQTVEQPTNAGAVLSGTENVVANAPVEQSRPPSGSGDDGVPDMGIEVPEMEELETDDGEEGDEIEMPPGVEESSVKSGSGNE